MLLLSRNTIIIHVLFMLNRKRRDVQNIHPSSITYTHTHSRNSVLFFSPSSSQTANVPHSSERRIRPSIYSTHIVTGQERPMWHTRYWSTQSVRQILLNIVVVLIYYNDRPSNQEGEQYLELLIKDGVSAFFCAINRARGSPSTGNIVEFNISDLRGARRG